MGECACALTAAGLDTRLGFLHATRAARPALALDFMEPFRPLIVDACATTALNRGQLQSAPTGTEEILETPNKQVLLQVYEERLATEARDATAPGVAQDNRKSWRDRLHENARMLAKALERGLAFHPLVRA
jgi:CRISPR/Cas system-associated endonuclease Cas1